MPEGSQHVAVDAQYGIVHTLRPYTDFAHEYQGQSSRTPIMFTEGGVALDPLAGQSGYDPALLRGNPCPEGARIVLWVPQIQPADPTTDGQYAWSVTWRYRNLHDARLSRQSWHLPKTGSGVPDGANARVVIPAAKHTIIFNQAEPTPSITTAGGVIQTIRPEDFSTRFQGGDTQTNLPLVPGSGTGHYQQGFGSSLFLPIYETFDLPAEGDELLIGLYRAVASDTWDFTAGHADVIVSELFGVGFGQAFPDIGVYLSFGSAP
jgi:hypothetical protein